MPPITPPAVTPLPTPPLRSDPANFAARADSFLGALPTLQTDLNAQAANAFANATDAADSSSAAAAARAAAQTAQGAAELAVQQTLAATAVPRWVSGTTYAQGALAWSPATSWTYRRSGAAGVSSTDPSADTANWALAAPAVLPVVTVGASTVALAAGARYSLTNAAATTATLPASPQAGQTLAVVAANGRRDNVIARGGQLLQGLAEDLTLNLPAASVTLTWVGGAVGWALTGY